MVQLKRSVCDYIHNLLFSKEKIMNTLNRRKFLSSSALLATSSLISVTANAAVRIQCRQSGMKKLTLLL